MYISHSPEAGRLGSVSGELSSCLTDGCHLGMSSPGRGRRREKQSKQKGAEGKAETEMEATALLNKGPPLRSSSNMIPKDLASNSVPSGDEAQCSPQQDFRSHEAAEEEQRWARGQPVTLISPFLPVLGHLGRGQSDE